MAVWPRKPKQEVIVHSDCCCRRIFDPGADATLTQPRGLKREMQQQAILSKRESIKFRHVGQKCIDINTHALAEANMPPTNRYQQRKIWLEGPRNGFFTTLFA